MRRAAATILVALMVTLGNGMGVAWAGYDEGLAAYKRGDHAEALREWRPLAEQGDVKVQFFLGVIYTKGHGVTRDSTKAVKWYRKAAERGNARAQYKLGVIYSAGKDIPKDYVQAHLWFNVADSVGYVAAARKRDFIANQMTPAQIATARKLAREWWARIRNQ
ncbi:MAG: tetratricopeptide repeat protein [Alphaproteobacteria bacterium]